MTLMKPDTLEPLPHSSLLFHFSIFSNPPASYFPLLIKINSSLSCQISDET